MNTSEAAAAWGALFNSQQTIADYWVEAMSEKDKTTRKQRRIAALQRMGYVAEFRSYYDGEIDGYAIYNANGEQVSQWRVHEIESEAWDEFLELIGKA
jgi:hypothetical protein